MKGAIIDVLGAYTDPVIRAMIATCVPQEELGKVYALIATAECIVPLIVSQAYATVFKVMDFPVTKKTYAEYVCWMMENFIADNQDKFPRSSVLCF